MEGNLNATACSDTKNKTPTDVQQQYFSSRQWKRSGLILSAGSGSGLRAVPTLGDSLVSEGHVELIAASSLRETNSWFCPANIQQPTQLLTQDQRRRRMLL